MGPEVSLVTYLTIGPNSSRNLPSDGTRLKGTDGATCKQTLIDLLVTMDRVSGAA